MAVKRDLGQAIRIQYRINEPRIIFERDGMEFKCVPEIDLPKGHFRDWIRNLELVRK